MSFHASYVVGAFCFAAIARIVEVRCLLHYNNTALTVAVPCILHGSSEQGEGAAAPDFNAG